MASGTALQTLAKDSRPEGERPWCETCNSDDFLIIETAAIPAGGPAGAVDVSYTCTECDGYSAHQVSAGALDPKVLARLLPDPGDEQLGVYTHREPMALGRTATRSIASETSASDSRNPRRTWQLTIRVPRKS